MEPLFHVELGSSTGDSDPVRQFVTIPFDAVDVTRRRARCAAPPPVVELTVLPLQTRRRTDNLGSRRSERAPWLARDDASHDASRAAQGQSRIDGSSREHAGFPPLE